MSTEEDIIVLATALLVCLCVIIKYKTKSRSIWVNSYLSKRKEKGRFVNDFEDMRQHNQTFRENFHMTIEQFDYIFEKTKQYLEPKRKSRPNDNITPKEKLCIGLEYLASGSMHRHIASVYRIGKQTFGQIIDDVCDAVCIALKDEMPPLSKADYVEKANEFHVKWNFPNCVGSVDGKHIRIKCPKGARSLFYNYKGFHSVILMAIVDACYRFIYIDVGGYGSEGDASYFYGSEVGRSIVDNTIELPEDVMINGAKIPFFFLGDSGFPLCERIITPYTQRQGQPTDDERVFNYRLSRARRCVENAFGILSTRFSCLSRTMFCKPDRVQKIVSACCILHNFLLNKSKSNYCPPALVDSYDTKGNLIAGEWRKKKQDLFHPLSDSGRFETRKGKAARNLIKDYVNSPSGRLSWQDKSIFKE